MSVFSGFPASPPDAILNLTALYNADPNPKKVNLGVGAYRDENGKPWILPAVKEAEAIISADLSKYNKEYPPVAGFPLFLEAAQLLMFGKDSKASQEGRIASCQSLSGTGSLHIGFEFLHLWMPKAEFYMPSTTWPNHYGIYDKVFDKLRVPYKEYTYLRKDGELEIDFTSTKKDIQSAPEKSIFLFHACAHNPSGIDFTEAQWRELLPIMKEKKHIAFFDSAYQGFATGSFEADAFAVRMFVDAGVEILVAQSFSKNFGLYGERIGCIHVVHAGVEGSVEKNKALSAAMVSGMTLQIRKTWSMSAIHGAYIVQTIVHDKRLLQLFYDNVKEMSARIHRMRTLLHGSLTKRKTPGPGSKGTWDHILTAIGMFTFTGLTPEHVDHLKDKWSIYLVKAGGRMSMCGLTESNCDYVAEAIHDAVTKFPFKK